MLSTTVVSGTGAGLAVVGRRVMTVLGAASLRRRIRERDGRGENTRGRARTTVCDGSRQAFFDRRGYRGTGSTAFLTPVWIGRSPIGAT